LLPRRPEAPLLLLLLVVAVVEDRRLPWSLHLDRLLVYVE
jgi:hypothetical protein